MAEFTIGNSNLINIWGNTGVTTEPAEAKQNTGWVAGEKPPPQFMNWVHSLQQSKINHIFANGVSQWNAATNYAVGAAVQYQGDLYTALNANLNSIPSTASVDWQPVRMTFTSSDSSVNSTYDPVTAEVDLTANVEFEDTDKIKWSVNAGKNVATYEDLAPKVRENEVVNVLPEDNGRTFYLQARTSNTTVVLPDSSTVPANWSVRITADNVIPANVILIQTQGSDTLLRNSIEYTQYQTSSSGVNLVITYVKAEAPTLTYVLSGSDETRNAAVCTATDVDNPADTQQVTVYSTQASQGLVGRNECTLNFLVYFGVVGGAGWSTLGNTTARAFLVDLSPLNIATNKYSQTGVVLGSQVSTELFAVTIGTDRKFTNVNPMVGRLGVSGGTKTNLIEVSAATLVGSRLNDAVEVSVEVKILDWVSRS